jgi:hypothetical protein
MYRKSILFVLVLSLVLTSVVKADLIGWWRFDDDFLDSSGLGNDGVPQGDPTFVEGYFGNALDLDGDDFVVIDAVGDDFAGTDITLSAWVKTTDSGADWFSCNTATRGNQVRLAIEGGKFGFDTDTEHALSTTTISDGEWHLLTFVRSGDIGYTYVDGVMENSYEPATNNTSDFVPSDLWSIGQEWDSGGPSGHITGLVDDARIYDHALVEAEILVIMQGGAGGYHKALGPDPGDGDYIEDTWANISWRAGDSAVSHDVYIGENFDDVSTGAESTFLGNQASTFFVVGFPGFAYPDGLVNGTTYYWRIDEVNDTEPNSPWKGDVWSFMVPPKTAYLPDPADGAASVDADPALEWTAGFGAKLHTVYFGNNFDEVSNAAGGLPQAATQFRPGLLKMAKSYYWRVDEFDAIDTHKGDVWSFTTEGAVQALNPANGAVDVSQTPVLTWAPGFGASHEVYFGADAGSLELKASGNLGEESYEPGQLEWNTTYYWRVDEANSANADSPWTGPLWSFTTANFLIIDDMEAYNDLAPDDPATNRIFNAWIDGFGDPTNGSLVGYPNPPFAEQSIVNSGNQSMPFEYDNAAGKSEATLTLTSNNDWTVNGVNRLTIWYRGSNSNTTETMYVTLNDSASVDNDNPDAALAPRWTEWNIDLQAFADQGVNLSNVTSITLGLRSATGGTGLLFFDDIRLYPPAP